ncbi:hypothetical protein GSI_00062 [Ganoderma sinense ZZ0214-1]|uniref:Uncharacterized protein n=1 Tax=Ganoderma sinense ZZ0214-1 TaxID=1077348 RepID=A0A2G8SRK3_9APHY|nr:hypothetical protein GSI_00062 [Ganoderma sinense ZZ0214-1]
MLPVALVVNVSQQNPNGSEKCMVQVRQVTAKMVFGDAVISAQRRLVHYNNHTAHVVMLPTLRYKLPFEDFFKMAYWRAAARLELDSQGARDQIEDTDALESSVVVA